MKRQSIRSGCRWLWAESKVSLAERLFELVATARERKRAAVGKCEGRKSCAEINPELVRQAKLLRRRRRGEVNARCVMSLPSLRSLASSISAALSSRLPRSPQCSALRRGSIAETLRIARRRFYGMSRSIVQRTRHFDAPVHDSLATASHILLPQ